MNPSEFFERRSFNKEELLAYANGTLLEDGSREMGRLPSPPLLMFDRIVEVEHDGHRGRIVAEQDIALDAWYFWCHFRNDPVQPGCLGVDAVWQLIGFYLMLRGVPGCGRALGCKQIDFSGQIRPHNRLVRYDVRIKRVSRFQEAGSSVAIGDATVSVDGEAIYSISDARVGAFAGIGYGDYPLRSRNSVGGLSSAAPARTGAEAERQC
ncbi:MAG TPA: bifunctional 3-hydroxydecanoyl-ACP dehydratase/trans-2-decenoyl-ACP isomerase [Bryobacteraceae bacterium]|jgi:3-hydroxyacyl-[acyl-carrier protein] dehydratase/trans-2-decenoyl-[acyl-carrier protein] isomerase